MSINRVNITGNLTRDPELRATAGGTQVLSFGVAVNDRRREPFPGKGKQGRDRGQAALQLLGARRPAPEQA